MTPHLSPLVEAGSYLFLSGQLAFDSQGQISGDIAAQTSRALANVAAVLATRGGGLSDIVKTTVWLTAASDYAAFNEAYAQAFGDHRPARSTVISQLAIPGALIEIEAVAQVPSA